VNNEISVENIIKKHLIVVAILQVGVGAG